MNSLARNALVCVGALALSILLAEGALRLFYPQQLYNRCYEDYEDPLLGIEVMPHAEFGWFPRADFERCRYDTRNQPYMINHNSQGVRLPYEIPYEKGTRKRVVILGDSFVYGTGLPIQDTIAMQLREQLGHNYEVIPLAAHAYSTDQEYLVLRNEGLKYDPDVVVLFVYPNDITPLTYTIHHFARKPVFVWNDEIDLLEIQNYPTDMAWYEDSGYDRVPLKDRQPLTALLLANSHLFSLFYHADFSAPEKTTQPESDFWVYYAHWQPWMQEEYNLFERLLMQFKKLSELEGFELIIVEIPARHAVDPVYQERLLKQSIKGFSDYDFKRFSKEMQRTMDKINVKYMGLKTISWDPELFYQYQDAHWSKIGTRYTAINLAPLVEEAAS